MIEIIILIIIFSSLVGTIFFGIYYFYYRMNIKKQKYDEVNEINSLTSKILNKSVFDKLLYGLIKMMPFIIFVSITFIFINIFFNPFDNQIQQQNSTSVQNENIFLQGETYPSWFFPLSMIITSWMIWRVIRRVDY